MKPVKQTVTEYPRANCFAACVASILEIPLSQIPPIIHQDSFGSWGLWADWFNALGIQMVHSSQGRIRGYGIATGLSPRQPQIGIDDPFITRRYHCVVVFDGKMVFDPYPTGGGLDGKPSFVTVLAPIDPAILSVSI
jgi:hypothetical protein